MECHRFNLLAAKWRRGVSADLVFLGVAREQTPPPAFGVLPHAFGVRKLFFKHQLIVFHPPVETTSPACVAGVAFAFRCHPDEEAVLVAVDAD